MPFSLLRLLSLVAFGLTVLARSDAQVDPELDRALKVVKQQIAMDDGMPGKTNPDGLKIQPIKIGTALAQSVHMVRYRFLVPRAPEGTSYSLGLMGIGTGVHALREKVYVNSKGLVLEEKAKPDQENKEALDEEAEVEIEVQAARGEPIRFVLVSTDRSVMIPGTVVPFPIEASGEKCTLEGRLGFPDGEAVLFYTSGFPPNTEVSYSSLSEGESHPGKATVQPNGTSRSILLPFVKGKDAGTLKISVDSPGCVASIQIPWGHGSYHPQ